jgi:hypothetical protein
VARKIITLIFDKKSIAEFGCVDNIYYLKEDLWRTFGENGLGFVEEPNFLDPVNPRIGVVIAGKHDVGAARLVIKKQMARYRLTKFAQVTTD